MADTDKLIDDILKKEGGYVNHPADKGGRTDKGITERDHPEAWKDNKVTEEEARDIYLKKYVNGPGFHQVTDYPLMSQLVDYGVNSGPAIAIQALQRVLKVNVDGELGPQTLAALAARDPREVNNLLMVERLRMFGRIVARNKSQAAFIAGWINRATEFLK